MPTLRLNGYLDNDGNEECQVSFKYRKVGDAGWTETSWTGSLNTGATFYTDVPVDTDKAYEVVARAENSAGEGDGSSQYAFPAVTSGPEIALLGDPSNHNGSIVSTNQDGEFQVGGVAVAVNGADHSCPVPGHGTTTITATVTKSYCNGKLILTRGDVAGCGAKIIASDRDVYVEP